jgi:hypothetical protein
LSSVHGHRHSACTGAEVVDGRVHVRALVRYLRKEQRKVRWEGCAAMQQIADWLAKLGIQRFAERP